jgi:hypothetical protein
MPHTTNFVTSKSVWSKCSWAGCAADGAPDFIASVRCLRDDANEWTDEGKVPVAGQVKTNPELTKPHVAEVVYGNDFPPDAFNFTLVVFTKDFA